MEILLVLAVVAFLLTPVLVLVTLGRVGLLRDEVVALQRVVERLAARSPLPSAPPEIRAPDLEPQAASRAVEPVGIPVPPPAPAQLAPARAIPPPVLAPPPDQARPVGDRPEPKRGRSAAAAAERLETAIGQRWLVRVGALVLVAGAGFFYAYAIDRGWIGVTQRAISGAISGLAVIALGLFFDRRGFKPLAQGFVACGSGILFLDVFASHRLYHLISAPVAVAALAAVTAITAAIALRWSALPLILLAQIGGYPTPFLLDESMPERARVVLAYVFVIDAGVLLVAALRRWRPVEVVAAVATPLIFLLGLLVLPPLADGEAVGWAAAFGVLFLGMSLAPALVRRERLVDVTCVIVVAAAAGVAFVAEDRLQGAPTTLAVVVGALGLIHAACAEGVGWRVAGDDRGRELLRAIGAALAIDAVRFPFGSGDTTLAFTALGVMLALAAGWRRSIAFRVAAASALAIGVGRVLIFHIHAPGAAVEPFANQDFAIGLLVAASAAAASLRDRDVRWIGLTAGALLGAMVTTSELALWITQSVPDPAYARALVWASRAVMLTGLFLGFSMAARSTRNAILAGIATVAALAAAIPAWNLLRLSQRPPQWLILNPTCLAGLMVAFGSLAAARSLHPAWRRLSVAFGIAGSVLPLVLLSFESLRFFRHLFPRATALVDAGSAAVSVTWAVYAALLLAIGISRRLRPVRLGALVLLGATLIKVVASDLSELDRLARIASFIALGIVLMAGAWAYHRFAALISGGDPPSHRRLGSASADSD